MRIGRLSIATVAIIASYTALTAAALATTGAGGYTTDPTNGDILTAMGFNSSINLNTIASTVAGPVAFITFMGGALHAASRIQQSQGHWHELIHSGATTGFLGIMLGGAGLYWSKTHQATGSLIPHAGNVAHAIAHFSRMFVG